MEGTNRLSEFLGDNGSDAPNQLWNYVQSLSPETIAHLSRPTSAEAYQVMERNIMGLLGGLPMEAFDISITTSRQALGQLLASAMMSGYFLRNAEQRMTFEKSMFGMDSETDTE